MDLKLNREEITATEVIFDSSQEQSAELDYVLPDYYPEIFKLVKCITTPKILSYSINGDKLTYELSLCIKILYCSEGKRCVQVVDQKMTYTKSVDLGRSAVNPKVMITPKTDYMNCRAVNQRRIDCRGAVSIKIKVCDLCKKDVVSDAYGMDIQLRKKSITYPVNKLYTTKRVTVSDEFDLGMSKPPIESILRSDATAVSSDKKVIANKLVAKGEVNVNMLYSCIKDNTEGIEAMQFNMPYSQIVDLEGIDERFDTSVDAEVLSCELEPRSDMDGSSKIVECTLVLLISCQAHRIATTDLVMDEYSTSYKSDSSKSDIKIELPPQQINMSAVVKSSMQYGDGALECIYDVWSCVQSYSVKPDIENGVLSVTGNIMFTAMAKNNENTAVVFEKDEPFTIHVPAENITETSTADLKIYPLSCSYNMASDNTVEAKTELRISGVITNSIYIPIITDISVNEDEKIKRDDDYALRLYFAEQNENLWEIAKKYGTAVSAIMEENDIDNDIITDAGMILIPIV